MRIKRHGLSKESRKLIRKGLGIASMGIMGGKAASVGRAAGKRLKKSLPTPTKRRRKRVTPTMKALRSKYGSQMTKQEWRERLKKTKRSQRPMK